MTTAVVAPPSKDQASKMKKPISKVVVLGAGTMGAQVAAHAASKDLEVVLLDMVPDGAEDRNALAKGAIARMRKLKPSPYHLPEHKDAIRAGKFEDDIEELADADWVDLAQLPWIGSDGYCPFETLTDDLFQRRGFQIGNR